mgnify:CR=1 FL=1
MLRVLFVVSLALPLAACSVGHVSLPFSLPSAGATPKSAAADPAGSWRGKTALGGPDAVAAARAAGAGDAANGAVDPPGRPATPTALDLVNDVRSGKGLAPLSVSPALTTAAQMQAANLARTGTLTHIGPDGSTPLDRVRRAGYKPRMAAENIAGGQKSAAEAIRSWRESESHLQNLLLPDARQMGIAQVDDPHSRMGTYWALVLGSPL